MSQFRSFRKCTTFARGSIGNSWEELEEYWCGWTFLSTRFSLKSCSHSGTKSCNSSLRHASSSSFLVFLVSADPRDGCHRDPTLIISLLSVAGFSVPTKESCDENVEESGEHEVEEIVDGIGTKNGTHFAILQLILLPLLVGCGFWPLVQW